MQAYILHSDRKNWSRNVLHHFYHVFSGFPGEVDFLVTDELCAIQCFRAGWELLSFYCSVLILQVCTVGVCSQN